MCTIKSTDRGIILGHYGSFPDQDTASRVAARVAVIARRDHGSTSTYTAVPVPDDVTPKPVHPVYTASINLG